MDVRYRELVVVRVKLFSLVFVRTHRLASRGREAGAIARKREWREEKKRRGAEKRIKVEEQEEEEEEEEGEEEKDRA